MTSLCADREGEIQAWCVDARRHAPGAAQRYWWAALQPPRALGTRSIALARQPARPPRQVTLAVTATQVTFNGARRPGGKRPPGEGSAVYAKEPRPPQGAEPVEWLRLTSLPVTDFLGACTVVQWSRCRWERAVFFRVLQQGRQRAPGRVQTDPRVRNALAIDVIVAWRIHHSTMAGRAYPAMSGEVIVEPRAWHLLETMPHHCHPPPPPLREMVRSLAQLGGFFARTRDGEPGIRAIWQGDQRLHACIDAIETYRTINA